MRCGGGRPPWSGGGLTPNGPGGLLGGGLGGGIAYGLPVGHMPGFGGGYGGGGGRQAGGGLVSIREGCGCPAGPSKCPTGAPSLAVWEPVRKLAPACKTVTVSY